MKLCSLTGYLFGAKSAARRSTDHGMSNIKSMLSSRLLVDDVVHQRLVVATYIGRAQCSSSSGSSNSPGKHQCNVRPHTVQTGGRIARRERS